MIEHKPHTVFVFCVCLAGTAMITLGSLRIKAGKLGRDDPYSPTTIVWVYSTMIFFGMAFIVLALRWRFFA